MDNKAGPQSVLWALFSLKGRIRRSTYGLGMALVFCCWWVALSQVFAANEGSENHGLWLIILGFVVIASTYCIYALCHKRLHDLGYPGYYAVPFVLFSSFLGGFLIIVLIGLGVVPGQREDNRFGPPPVV